MNIARLRLALMHTVVWAGIRQRPAAESRHTLDIQRDCQGTQILE
jgi:hypothetical protein